MVLAVITIPKATPVAGDAINALDTQIQRKQQSLNSARSAQEQQLTTQAENISKQLHTAIAEAHEIEAEIAIRHNQIHIAHEIFERLQKLQESEYVSLLQNKLPRPKGRGIRRFT